MRILLTGANGQVGTELRRSLAPLGQVIASTRSGTLPDGNTCEQADFNQPASLGPLVARLRPDVVANAAAYTAVDRAETEPELAYRINAEAVDALARACADTGARLVHYSTDYVFPGDSEKAWREDDQTGPLNTYGASKLAGEHAIQDSGCRHLIFRIAWIYAAHGHNFVRTMLRLAAERDMLTVVDDQHGTPTPAHWVANATTRVLAGRPDGNGTWHVAPQGHTTWHGFASRILRRATEVGLLKRMPEVTPVRSSAFPTSAPRPAWSTLDSGRALAELGIKLPAWEVGLEEVLADLTRTAGQQSTVDR